MAAPTTSTTVAPEPVQSITTLIIICTICLAVLYGFVIEGLTILWKIPDMNSAAGNDFSHNMDVMIGAICGALTTYGIMRKSNGSGNGDTTRATTSTTVTQEEILSAPAPVPAASSATPQT